MSNHDIDGHTTKTRAKTTNAMRVGAAVFRRWFDVLRCAAVGARWFVHHKLTIPFISIYSWLARAHTVAYSTYVHNSVECE